VEIPRRNVALAEVAGAHVPAATPLHWSMGCHARIIEAKPVQLRWTDSGHLIRGSRWWVTLCRRASSAAHLVKVRIDMKICIHHGRQQKRFKMYGKPSSRRAAKNQTNWRHLESRDNRVVPLYWRVRAQLCQYYSQAKSTQEGRNVCRLHWLLVTYAMPLHRPACSHIGKPPTHLWWDSSRRLSPVMLIQNPIYSAWRGPK